MRTYYGHVATKDHGFIVTVRDTRSPDPLAHHLRYSPTGYSWGAGGDGSLELSRCILLDSFGSTQCPDTPKKCRCAVKWVEPTYRAFQSDFIMKFPKDADWKLGQGEVVDWVFDYLGHRDGNESVPAMVATT